MARCAVPARVVVGGTKIRATPAFERAARLHAARTSQRDVPSAPEKALGWSGGSPLAQGGELNASEKIHIRHYLVLDDEFTWWQCGRSYLCRVIDMMHMGYVDEVIFGRETVERIPALVAEWVAIIRSRSNR